VVRTQDRRQAEGAGIGAVAIPRHLSDLADGRIDRP
jgi:hypothetical protein